LEKELATKYEARMRLEMESKVGGGTSRSTSPEDIVSGVTTRRRSERGGRAGVIKGDFGGEFSFRRWTALMVR
jgi:hypothetical protein